ncbi:hypothetical protein A2634_04075 [Candidatus Amesbacteria bacterium RIFCSPHIGHO2_01_FULL_48_32]|uniref:Uncharacterized protein n=1 Tax=Candidatus Amesbacteria bacterium RIFCSPLOWO2_01_FULL_48_25 TaxID=1797259 RepID=A0A1F4ZE07_9BACT|nr:MAG: hypothetical protein A2634_04075 [Candidatus Amesbacteria bacterium RIFCSPHIGHO2_01_FULL_48_32]OGD03917.1 MAG: hypothetical protein A2989_04430 [Candidatus Amesbacteria bacterium RIFCSPLOWO2_01_FULL_48_25]HJZ05854.1 hypothetical protein [Patescibacteria group bacterium]
MLTYQDLKKIGEMFENKFDERFKINIKPIQSTLRKVNKDIKLIINFFDREMIDLRKRVKVIERELNLNQI